MKQLINLNYSIIIDTNIIIYGYQSLSYIYKYIYVYKNFEIHSTSYRLPYFVQQYHENHFYV